MRKSEYMWIVLLVGLVLGLGVTCTKSNPAYLPPDATTSEGEAEAEAEGEAEAEAEPCEAECQDCDACMDEIFSDNGFCESELNNCADTDHCLPLLCCKLGCPHDRCAGYCEGQTCQTLLLSCESSQECNQRYCDLGDCTTRNCGWRLCLEDRATEGAVCVDCQACR